MDVARRADVDAADRLGDEQDARFRRELAGEDQLLDVAAREVVRGRVEIGRLDVEGGSTSSSQWRRIARERRKPSREKAGAPLSTRSRFSATLKSGTMPSRMRSSGTKPSPAARTAAGLRPATSAPSIRIEPLRGPRSPAIASASSRCPLPETPAIATISPERTSSERPRDRLAAAVAHDVEVVDLQPELADGAGGRELLGREGVSDHHLGECVRR